jgi:heme a synthase
MAAEIGRNWRAGATGETTGANRAVALWLCVVAALVFAMIVVGGATRLTESGLSITEWQPLLGAIPPLNDADWQAAFEKYKLIPQYHVMNQDMTLEAFKAIYWWEWSHRLLGRLIGVVFALPLIFFWWTGRLKTGTGGKFIGIFALGALQGVIGWYMVKSGLVDRVDVSQYRLALHLTTAFTLLGLLLWLALEEWPSAGLAEESFATTPAIRRMAIVLLAAVLLQVVLGAFVAGLKAGLIYNTWPTMDGQWFPSDYWITPPYLSFFESHAAAQFNHRVTAYAVGVLALFNLWLVLRSESSRRLSLTASALVAGVFVQMMLGIATLLMHVPLGFGLLHQAGGAVVFMLAIVHCYTATRTDRSALTPARL